MADVSIVGAGAVGLAMADALSRSGVSVELVVREARLADLQKRGLWIKRPAKSVAPISATLNHRVQASTVILTPKTFALQAALTELRDDLQKATQIVAVQNGLGADQLVADAFPTAQRFGGIITFAATSLRPGEVSVDAVDRDGFELALGSAQQLTLEELKNSNVFQLLQKGLKVSAVRQLEGARWTKLIVNLNNGLLAATRRTAQQFFAHPQGSMLATLAMREGLMVARKSKARLQAIPWASPLLLHSFALLPLPLAVKVFERRAEEILNSQFTTYGSTLQSLMKREPTEIDDLNGAIVRLGDAVGVQTPINAAATEAVRTQGRGGSPVAMEKLFELSARNALQAA